MNDKIQDAFKLMEQTSRFIKRILCRKRGHNPLVLSKKRDVSLQDEPEFSVTI